MKQSHRDDLAAANLYRKVYSVGKAPIIIITEVKPNK